MNESEIIDVEAEEVKPQPSRWRRLWRWTPWLLLLLVGIFAGGVLSAPWLAGQADGRLPWLFAPPPAAPASQPTPDPALAAEIESLQAELGSLRAALDRLVKAPPQAPGGDASAVDLAPLNQRIDQLAAAVSALEAGGGDAALASRLVTLENQLAALRAAQDSSDRALEQSLAMLDARLAAIEQKRDAGNARDMAVLALRQLSRSVLSGRPYGADLAELRGLLGEGGIDSAALSVLEAYGARGVPTPADLEARFLNQAKDWLVAAQTPADAGMLDRLWARAQAMISVRRTDIGEGDSAEALLAQAERRLAARDLDGAVKAVERLPAPGLAAAKPWLEEANARLAAEQALTQLESALFDRAPAGAPAAP
ncbi:MAG: hypothetical protein Tsb0016_21250 [Sphingomonadales bacterium]